ncbi:hypothetical protein [Paraburkholderia sp.]|uniref:hypothetical protein n=1 Tax=Paraburkholderia sp. TaxID=1926495 RepID=UPI003D6FA152
MHPREGTFYGQGDIVFYRTHARPLSVGRIPESEFTGRPNTIIGMRISVTTSGAAYQRCYTEGDNEILVPTQTFGNYISESSDSYEGSTIEGCVDFLARGFLGRYPQMTHMTIEGSELPFLQVRVPGPDGFQESDALYQRSDNEHATVSFEYEKIREGEIVLREHLCGLGNLNLVKMNGNAFAGFPGDEYSNIAPRHERILYLAQDFFWRYLDPQDAIAGTDRYIPAEWVRDIVRSTWHHEKNQSIQHLQYQITRNVLRRFPQLAEFRARRRNVQWKLLSTEDAPAKAYTDRLAYGDIGFAARREDIE